MRTSTLAAGVAAAVISVTVVAVPAFAGTSPTSAAASSAAATKPPAADAKPLTAAQLTAVDAWLAAPPAAAQKLAARTQRWTASAAAHPEIAAELTAVRALPADQRRAALKAWLGKHPEQKAALKQWRQERAAEVKQRRAARGSATAAPAGT